MKRLVLGLLVFFSGIAVAVETSDYTDQSSHSESFSMDDFDNPNRPLDEHEIWSIEFYKYLFNQDEINLAIKGLAQLNGVFAIRVEMKTGEKIVTEKQEMNLIERGINSPSVDFGSLMLLHSMCLRISRCDADAIQKRLESEYSDNQAVYLAPLRQAMSADDHELVNAILTSMSQSSRSHLMHPINESFEVIAAAYLKENPMPEDDLADLGIDWQNIDLHELSLSNLLTIDKLLGIIYNSSISSIYKACEWSENNHNLCLKITETMLANSDNFLLMHVGYELRSKIFEWQGNAKALSKAKAEEESFVDYMRCLGKMQSQNNMLDHVIDPQAVRLFYEGRHEMQVSEQVALYLYDKWQQQGITGLVDPRTCGLRYVEE